MLEGPDRWGAAVVAAEPPATPTRPGHSAARGTSGPPAAQG